MLPGRGDHRAGGQAAPPRARLLRPHGAAPARRAAGRARPSRRAGPGRRRTAARSGSSSTTPTRRRCRRASGSATTTPGSSRSRATSPTRATTSRWSPRTCRCGSRPPPSASTPRSTAPRRSPTPTPARPAWPSSRSPAADARRAVRRRRPRPRRRRATCPATPAWSCCPSAGTALGRVGPDKQVHLVRGDREAFGMHGRSAEQRIALDLLLDPEVGIVSLGGRAGTGKSALALCAGLEAVLERRQHQQGRGVPAAVRRRRPGARLPARRRSRRRCRPGRRRSSTPSAR